MFELLERWLEHARTYSGAIEFAHQCIDKTFAHDVLKNTVAAACRCAVGGFPRTLIELRVPGTTVDVIAGGVPIEVKVDPDTAVKGSAWKKQVYYAGRACGSDLAVLTNGRQFSVVKISSIDVSVVDEIEVDPLTLREAARVFREIISDHGRL